jgi:lipoprotein-anchoring transpeptidase ErfK/SrfK
MNTSRRSFLKWSSLLAGGLLLPPLPPDEAPRQVEQLGRAVRGLYVYERPSFQSRQLNFLSADTVFNIFGSAPAEEDLPNKTWWRVRRGFVHSPPVQLVRWEPQAASTEVPEGGFLGEVSVPVAASRLGPGSQYKFGYRFYYGTTHWITRASVDEAGQVWYGVRGDRTQAFSWVKGEQIHRVTPEEIASLSPEVQDKRIEVSLEQQLLRCYEAGRLVLEAPCSTGVPLRRENGQVIYGTPVGEWQVIRKRASRHMAGDDLAAADFFDLPGVPWVSYIHWWGVAIHGTYWHNDFGRPRSHGCINLPNETAKWIYRWTMPVVPPGEEELEAKGTDVVVAY